VISNKVVDKLKRLMLRKMISLYEKQSLIFQTNLYLKSKRLIKPHIDYNLINDLIHRVHKNMLQILEIYFVYNRAQKQLNEFLKCEGLNKDIQHSSRNADSEYEFMPSSMDRQFY
jgi:hypothetical protein